MRLWWLWASALWWQSSPRFYSVDPCCETSNNLPALRTASLRETSRPALRCDAAISAALEAIDDGIGDPSARIAAARGDARALTLLVEDLFLLARVDAGRFVPPSRPVDLAEIVDEAAEALLPTAAAGGVNLVATNV